jgi:hypothetical protein
VKTVAQKTCRDTDREGLEDSGQPLLEIARLDHCCSLRPVLAGSDRGRLVTSILNSVQAVDA